MYAHCFPEHLAFFADAFTRDPSGPACLIVPGQALVSGQSLDRVIHLFANSHEIRDRRAAATDWSKYFFARLIVPTVVIQHTMARRIDFAPGNWQVHCRDDGTASRFVFGHGPAAKTGPPDALSSLIDHVLSPLIAALVTHVRLSPRVFASNAAMYFAWALEQLAPLTSRQHKLHALLASPRRSDGGYNPFYSPFKSLPGNALDGDGKPTRRCRKLCCVRDLDPALALCANCPRAITYGPRDLRPPVPPVR